MFLVVIDFLWIISGNRILKVQSGNKKSGKLMKPWKKIE